MGPTAQELAAHYAEMSETELMELARSWEGLTPIAQQVLRAEFDRRRLQPPLLDAPRPDETHRLVTVRRYRDLAEAFVARSLLESAGITAWIADENLVRLDWFYSNLVGGMRLQVDAGDEAAAREILEERGPHMMPPEELEGLENREDYVQPTCPRCGSTDPAFVGMVGDGARWMCPFCRIQWTEHDEPEPRQG